MDAQGQTKETISLSLREPTRREVASRAAVVHLVYVREINDEMSIVERLYSACATEDDAALVADALCGQSPEWQGVEPKAFAEPMPLITFADWSRRTLASRAKAKLTAAELDALIIELRGAV